MNPKIIAKEYEIERDDARERLFATLYEMWDESGEIIYPDTEGDLESFTRTELPAEICDIDEEQEFIEWKIQDIVDRLIP